MDKEIIKLTEAELKKLVIESVNSVLNEISYDLAQRAFDKMNDKGQRLRARQLAKTYGEIYDEKNPDGDKPYWLANYDLEGRSLRLNGETTEGGNELYNTYTKNYNGDVEEKNYSGYEGRSERSLTQNPAMARKYAKHIKRFDPDTKLTKDDFRR